MARRQLLAAGVSRNMIHTMLHTGLLVARHRGVYAFGHAAPGELTRETEALLAIRVPAFLSAGSSLALWSLAPPPRPSEPVEITVLAPHSIRHPGIRAHRSSTLDAPDTRIHRGLPTTSPARALVDVAGTTSEFRLERMLDDALHRNLVRLSQLRDALDRAGPTHKGRGHPPRDPRRPRTQQRNQPLEPGTDPQRQPPRRRPTAPRPQRQPR
ncbi:MAG: hypothetical protein ACJ76X_19410, partial [Solirubrobacteraceae bacterium]